MKKPQDNPLPAMTLSRQTCKATATPRKRPEGKLSRLPEEMQVSMLARLNGGESLGEVAGWLAKEQGEPVSSLAISKWRRRRMIRLGMRPERLGAKPVMWRLPVGIQSELAELLLKPNSTLVDGLCWLRERYGVEVSTRGLSVWLSSYWAKQIPRRGTEINGLANASTN